MKRYGYLISLGIGIFLSVCFGYLYFHNHAYGAWGDDSPGYIYLWGRMSQNKQLVYKEPLTVKALNFFHDEKLARWTTPTHHEIISPQGYLASKYPIGLSQIMYIFSKIFNSELAVYYVLPGLATFIVILTYLICNIIFFEIKWKYFFSVGAAIIVGLASLFYEAAVSQPMREIPSIFFMLFGYYCLLQAMASWQRNNQNKQGIFFYLLIILAFLNLGMSINIRETSLVILPAFLILFWEVDKKNKMSVETCHGMSLQKKSIIKLSLISVVILIVGLAPSIINSINISQYKEKFKKKDITSVAITSNFDHIRSFSFSNLFNNNGKFKSGDQGGLEHYWQTLLAMSPLPYFMLLVVIGFIYLYKKNKWQFASLIWWLLSFLVVFSLWINPYSRYILPLFPLLGIISMYGLYNLIVQLMPQYIKNKKWQFIIGVVIICSSIVSYQPVIAQMVENIKLSPDEIHINKSISLTDLNKLEDIGSRIILNAKQQPEKKPLLMFTGAWQYGLSETLEAHTGLQSIRMPLEQKFDFNEDKVKEFFDQTLLTDYQLYIWLDTSTKPETRDWLDKNYSLQKKITSNFSFEEETTIYEITPKN